jgi:hypothetical protein
VGVMKCLLCWGFVMYFLFCLSLSLSFQSDRVRRIVY